MREDSDRIEKALDLRKKGYTLSQIADELGGITRQSVHRWIHKFQEPIEEKTIKRKMKNQYGTYERTFKIKV